MIRMRMEEHQKESHLQKLRWKSQKWRFGWKIFNSFFFFGVKISENLQPLVFDSCTTLVTSFRYATGSVLFRGKPTPRARFISPIGHRMYGFFLGYQDSQPYPNRINGTGIWQPSFDEFSCFSCRYVPYIIEAAKIVHIVHLCCLHFVGSSLMLESNSWFEWKKNRKRKPPSEMQGTMMHPIHHGVQPELTPLGRRKKGPTKSMVMLHLDLTLPKMDS